jgi:hypothetical protein
VWANTIATVLVALSIGYWLGGRLADRHPHTRGLGVLCLIAATLLGLVPFAADPFLGLSVDAFDEIAVDAFAGSLIGVLVLIALPVVLLGAASPWAVRLWLERVEDEHGRVIYEAETGHQYVRVVERPDGSRRLELNEGRGVHSRYVPGTTLTCGAWDGYLVLPFAARRTRRGAWRSWATARARPRARTATTSRRRGSTPSSSTDTCTSSASASSACANGPVCGS